MNDDNWRSASAYDRFMGRWSLRMAREFLDWLDPESGLHWMDLGCGTGALTRAALERADPKSILACDPSQPFVDLARRAIRDRRVTFAVGRAEALPHPGYRLDVVACGLVLNFIPDPLPAILSVKRRMAPQGTFAAYVWDYADGMEFLRKFWDAAVELDPSAANLDEAVRFPLCGPDALQELFSRAALQHVSVQPLEITTTFESFADYWDPFLGGTGPAPTYVQSLGNRPRERLAETLLARLPANEQGSITLSARAWGVRGSIGS